MTNTLLNDQALDKIDRRTYVLEALTMRHQFHVTANLVEFTPEIIYVPAVVS